MKRTLLNVLLFIESFVLVKFIYDFVFTSELELIPAPIRIPLIIILLFFVWPMFIWIEYDDKIWNEALKQSGGKLDRAYYPPWGGWATLAFIVANTIYLFTLQKIMIKKFFPHLQEHIS